MSFLPIASTYRTIPRKLEIDEPFMLDAVGEVASSQDPSRWARNHILALLLTSQGERVMRPDYGAGLRRFIFENNDPVVVADITARIQTSLQQWEPSLSNVKVDWVPTDTANGVVEIRISFTIHSSPVRHTTAFTVSGQGVEV